MKLTNVKTEKVNSAEIKRGEFAIYENQLCVAISRYGSIMHFQSITTFEHVAEITGDGLIDRVLEVTINQEPV